MAVNETELKNSMMGEAARTQRKSKETAGALGTKMPDSINRKAYRSGKKMLAQKELDRYDRETKKVIDDLVKRTQFADQASQERFRTDLQNKFNSAKKFIFEQELSFRKSTWKEGRHAKKEMARLQMFDQNMADAGQLVGMGLGSYSSGQASNEANQNWGAANRGNQASQNINTSYEGAGQTGGMYDGTGTQQGDVIQHGADAPSGGFDPGATA